MGWNKSKETLETSIIVCNYNYEKFLPEALDSCLNTTASEIIVVDDCSTDESWLVIEHYKNRNKGRVKEITLQENYGARERPLNIGIEIAKGKYIVTLDADDTLNPEYFEKVLPAFISDNVGVVCTECKRFGDEDGVMLRCERPWGEDKLTSLLEGNKVFGASCFRRAAWYSVGGYEENEYFRVAMGDWDFWIRIAIAGWEFADVEGFLWNYRVHKSSGSFQRDFGVGLNYMARKFKTLLKEKGVTKGPLYERI